MLGLVEPFVHLEWRRLKELHEPLQRAKEVNLELRSRVDSLKDQLRSEVERRAGLEEQLVELDDIHERKEQLEQRVAQLEKSLSNTQHLLAATRRSQRLQADKLLSLKSENSRLAATAGETEEQRQRAELLSNQLVAKDAVVQRQARTAATLKKLIDELGDLHPDVRLKIRQFFSPLGLDLYEEDGEEIQQRQQQQQRNPRQNVRLRPASATAAAAATAADSAADDDDNSRLLAARCRTAGHSMRNKHGRTSAHSIRSLDTSSGQTNPSRSSTRQDGQISRASGSQIGSIGKNQLDFIAALYLHLGDRVTVAIQGEKTTGIVKFVGESNADPTDGGSMRNKGKVWIGVRLLEPIGNSDGSLHGVRHFAVKYRFAAFVRAHQIIDVFNQKKRARVSISDCINSYLQMQQ